MHLRISAATTALILAASTACPAAAHDRQPEPAYPAPQGYPAPYPGSYQGQYGGYDPAARDAWLADCRRRLSSRDSGVGGAVIGGVVGGVAGNLIAGHGNRTVGTIAGAAVGAAAGAAIDKAEDKGRNRDECEAYLVDYYTRYAEGAPGPGPGYTYGQSGYGAYPGYGYPAYGAGYGYPPAYGYAYAQPCCMAQPVMMVPAKPQCTETVEYVYEDVPVPPRKRYVPKPTKIVPDKRVKIVPQKTIKTK